MKRPNVIILHTDQQRADCLGCMGNQFARTPNIDRLAASGTVFTRHIVSNPVCCPSRASFFTGLYPPGHGVWITGVPLNRKEYVHADTRFPTTLYSLPEPATFGDVFGAAGYDTAAFGKIHLTPWLAPESYGYPETMSLWQKGKFKDWHGPYYGFQRVDMTLGHGEGTCNLGPYGEWLQREHPDAYRALKESKPSRPVKKPGDLHISSLPVELHHSLWLADRLCRYMTTERPKDRPFLAFVGFPDPHHPFTPCFDVVKQFADAEVKEPSDADGKGVEGSPLARFSQQNLDGFSDEEIRTVIRYTYAMVFQIDLAAGKILAALEAAGLADDTIVVFTSDHGDFLGDHHHLRKGMAASNSLLHVPFVLRAPGSRLPSRVDTPMSNCDVLPTLAALAGVPLPQPTHGADIASIVRGGKEHAAFAFSNCGSPESVNHTIYDATHRLTWYPALDYVELFDHRSDPGECRNVARAPENHARIQLMKHQVMSKLAETYNPTVGRVSAW